jgi:hypothetical protein
VKTTVFAALVASAVACGVACGGAPFELGAVVAVDGGATAEAGGFVVDGGSISQVDGFRVSADVVAEDAAEAARDVGAAPDAAAFDAPAFDVQVADVGRADVDAGVVDAADAAACAPSPPATSTCGLNREVISSPGYFCWLSGFGSASPQGTATTTPPACRCADTYNCVCLMAELRPTCGGVPARCSEGTALIIECQ